MYVIFGFLVYFIHKSNVARKAPDTLIAKNISWLTQACRKGFTSNAWPLVTRNLVIRPSAVMRPNSVYSINLMIRLLTLKRFGTSNMLIYLNVCQTNCLNPWIGTSNNTIRTQLIPSFHQSLSQLSPNRFTTLLS